MSNAGHERALPDDEPERDSVVREVVAQYLRREKGDASRALHRAVADGIAVSAKVSCGFMRWGQPERERR